MTFDLKDLIYIVAYIISGVSIFLAFKNRIAKVETINRRHQKVIFLEKGGLNLINNDTCKDHRDAMDSNITSKAELSKEALQDIKTLNQNIIKIMMHMKLEPIILERKNGE